MNVKKERIGLTESTVGPARQGSSDEFRMRLEHLREIRTSSSEAILEARTLCRDHMLGRPKSCEQICLWAIWTLFRTSLDAELYRAHGSRRGIVCVEDTPIHTGFYEKSWHSNPDNAIVSPHCDAPIKSL